MHTMNIILSSTSTNPGKLIRLFTKYQYNHASFSFDDNFSRYYTFARKYNNNPFVGGYLEEKPIYFSCGREEEINVQVYRIDITDEQYDRIKNHLEEIAKDPAYMYNLIGIILFPLHLNFSISKSYNCCEFIITLLHEAGIVKLNKRECRYTPEDIAASFQDQLWYEGPISKLAECKREDQDPFFEKKSFFFHFRYALYHVLVLLKRAI